MRHAISKLFKFCFFYFENSILVVSKNCLKEYIKFEHVCHGEMQKLHSYRFLKEFVAFDIREQGLITLDQDLGDLI